MSVIDTVEALPTTGLTVSALEALDYQANPDRKN